MKRNGLRKYRINDPKSFPSLGFIYLIRVIYPTFSNCIFEPTTIPEVQFAVGLLAITGTTYAIRSGGHSPFAGFASTNDGVLIAMHKMTTVSYDAGTETVRLGMGNTWGDVYKYLIQYNRIVVGGRLPPVGMALVTGGT